MSEIDRQRDLNDWRHWRGAMQKAFGMLPSLTIYGSYRNKLMLIAGVWTWDSNLPLANDNEKRA